MRSADAATLSRVILAILVVYGIFLKLNPVLLIAGIVVERIVDGLDGYFAIREASSGRLGFISYVNASIFGNPSVEKQIKNYKEAAKKAAPYGARIDIAGDRAVEYMFWLTFTYLNLVPLWVFILVIIRHTFVDAIMGARGTSAQMKTKFGQMVYSSNFSRAMINAPKTLAFSYLVLVYILGWPLWIGYVLVAVFVINIMLRGIAQIYDSFA